MQKLLYILPIVLLMGFNPSIKTLDTFQNEDSVVFYYDSTGIGLNGEHINKSWTMKKVEGKIGKPDRGYHSSRINYDVYDVLGINFDQEISESKASRMRLVGISVFFDVKNKPQFCVEAKVPKTNFRDKFIIFNEEITKTSTSEELNKKLNKHGFELSKDKKFASMRHRGQSIMFFFIESKISVIMIGI